MMTAPGARPPTVPLPGARPPAGMPSGPVIAKGLDQYVARHKDKLAVQPTSWDDPAGGYLVALLGEKGCGKSSLWAGLPGKTLAIAFDGVTKQSLIKRYPDKTVLRNIDLIEVSKPILGPDGKILVPGFNPGDPVSGEVVLARAYKALLDAEAAGGVDNVVLDHFGYFFEGAARNVAYAKAGADIFAKLEFGDWNARTTVAKMLEAKARQVARNAVFVTGYPEKEIETLVKDDNGKTVMGKGVKRARWFEKIQEDYNLILEAKRVQIPGTPPQFRWTVEVVDSRVPGFNTGQEFDVTGKNLGDIWPKVVEAATA